MCKCSCTKLFTLAWIVALLALVTAGNSVSFADGCPTNCSANRFNIDVQADKSEIKNGDTVNYTVTAFNNLNPFTDGCDAGVSSCNSVSGHGVIVQLCCPSPTGAAYPLFDFAPSHCTELSTASVGDNFPAGSGGTLKVYPPVPCVVTLNSGLTQATANAAGGDATNPNTPDPSRGTIHFPAGDKGVQGSKPIPVIVDICGDGTINQTCETCDGSAFPSTAPSSHGACRTGQDTCGVIGCTFCGDGIVNGGEACDDGNAIDTDSCRNNCTLPTCGDGIINQTCETCDTNAFPSNAPSSHGACRTGATCGADACTFCGDGIKNGNEECDDGNDVNNDSCQNDCTPPALPAGCRITAGGVTPNGGVDPASPGDIQRASFGGQVGAPFGCIGSFDDFNQIQGEWQHTRHKNAGTFHAMELQQPRLHLRPRNRRGGPQGRTLQSGEQATRSGAASRSSQSCLLLRSRDLGADRWQEDAAGRLPGPEVEDRSEPGTGKLAPDDYYRIRIWIPVAPQTRRLQTWSAAHSINPPPRPAYPA